MQVAAHMSAIDSLQSAIIPDENLFLSSARVSMSDLAFSFSKDVKSIIIF